MKHALVLGGGGSRGAYEMGAWKAFLELGMEFQIVAGTSIGAINGALYVQQDYENAKALWNSISLDQIITDGVNFERSIEALYDNRKAIGSVIKGYLNYKGADITPLKKLLSQHLDEKRFFASPIDFGLITIAVPSMVPHEYLKSQISQGYLFHRVMSSASIFPAFPFYHVDDTDFMDGMYYDNLPIDTAFRLGADDVVAINLSTQMPHKSYEDHPLVKLIQPEKPLGSFLQFTQESVQKNIQLGYTDTMKAYGHFLGEHYTFSVRDPEYIEKFSKQFLLTLTRLDAGTSEGFLKGRYQKKRRKLNLLKKKLTQPDSLTLYVRAIEMLFDVFLLPPEPIYCLDDATLLLRQQIRKSRPEGAEHSRLLSSLIQETETVCQNLCNENFSLPRYEKTNIHPILLGILLDKS